MITIKTSYKHAMLRALRGSGGNGDNNIYCDLPNSSVIVEYLSGTPKTKKEILLSYLPLIYGRKELL